MADMLSGISGAGGGDLMRLTGMATGLDVDATVKKMLLGEQKRVDKAKQDKQKILWKQETYKEVIKDTKALQDKYFNITSNDSLINSKNYSDYKIDSTSSTVATAVGSTTAMEGNYKINVEKMAKSAVVEGESLYSQIQVKSVFDWVSTSGDLKSMKIKLGDKEADINISTGLFNLQDIVSDINKSISQSDLSGKVSVAYVNDGKNDYIKFNNLDSENELNISNSNIDDIKSPLQFKNISSDSKLKDLGVVSGEELKINYKNKTVSIKCNEEDSIQDLMNSINNNKDLNGEIVASFDKVSGKISIATKKTGSTQTLRLEGDILKNLKIKDTSLVSGEDALVTITKPDGSSIKMTEESNNFDVNGLKVNLNGEGETTLNVSKDVDKTFDRIKGFIDDYNALIGKINGKLTERKDYDYKPLTEAQKKEMKDDEIKAWEERAKKGVLRNDDNLQRMMSELRKTFFTAVEGVGINFGRTIGLDTTKKVSTAGQIEFTEGGEEKLKKVLREKPEEVMALFNKTYKLTEDDKKQSPQKQREIEYNNSGIFQRMNKIFKDYVGNSGTTLNTAILTKYANKQEDFSYTGTGRSNNLPDQIYRKDERIKQLQVKMKQKEEKLYQQFSRLEVIMNKYNAQATWLAQQFGGM